MPAHWLRDVAKKMLRERQGTQFAACEICGKVEGEGQDVLRLDHDHMTGSVRGLLCNTCNIGLGGLGDTLERAEAAVAYLRRHHVRQRELTEGARA